MFRVPHDRYRRSENLRMVSRRLPGHHGPPRPSVPLSGTETGHGGIGHQLRRKSGHKCYRIGYRRRGSAVGLLGHQSPWRCPWKCPRNFTITTAKWTGVRPSSFSGRRRPDFSRLPGPRMSMSLKSIFRIPPTKDTPWHVCRQSREPGWWGFVPDASPDSAAGTTIGRRGPRPGKTWMEEDDMSVLLGKKEVAITPLSVDLTSRVNFQEVERMFRGR